MNVYQAHYRDVATDESGGYRYFPTRGVALKAKRDDEARGCYKVEIVKLVIQYSKVGIIRALNDYAGHADNG